MTKHPDLVLGSSSAYRAQLLSRLGLPFETASPGIDESTQPGESASDLVKRLALEKARAVQDRYDHSCVIGSDQVACFGETILGKPLNTERAEQQLALLSSREVRFLTGLCVLDQNGKALEHVDQTIVQFRALDQKSIERYVHLEQPLNCAGSFKSEGLGVCLFETIRSQDPTALIGLPLIRTAQFLRYAGLDPLA